MNQTEELSQLRSVIAKLGTEIGSLNIAIKIAETQLEELRKENENLKKQLAIIKKDAKMTEISEDD